VRDQLNEKQNKVIKRWKLKTENRKKAENYRAIIERVRRSVWSFELGAAFHFHFHCFAGGRKSGEKLRSDKLPSG